MSSTSIANNTDATISEYFLTSMNCEEDGNSSPKLIVSESLTDSDDFSSISNHNTDQNAKNHQYNDTATETVTSFQDGQEVQLDDGSTALLFHNSKDASESCTLELIQQVQLDNGSTAFLCQTKSPNVQNINVSELSSPVIQFPASLPLDMRDMRRNFTCDYEDCNKVYTTAHHLKVHKRTHTGEKPFVCKWSNCNKVFTTSYALKSHNRVHTGEKPYTCTEPSCKKAFKTSGDLQKHVRTHTGEKPFKCPFEGCGKAFTTSNICKVHIRTHTGERPHKCTYPKCMKTFSNITNYKNHMRIHTGEKPYLCDAKGCGKQFTEYSSLYKHQVVHCVVKPFMCMECGKAYRQPSTLAQHHKKMHRNSSSLPCSKKQKSVTHSADGNIFRGNALFPNDDCALSGKSTSVVVESVETLPSCLPTASSTKLKEHKPNKGTPKQLPTSFQDGTIYLNRPSASVAKTWKHNSADNTDLIQTEETDSTGWLNGATSSSNLQTDVSGDVSKDQQQQQIHVEFPFATFELNGAKFMVQMLNEGSDVAEIDGNKAPLLAASSAQQMTLRLCDDAREESLSVDERFAPSSKSDPQQYVVVGTPQDAGPSLLGQNNILQTTLTSFPSSSDPSDVSLNDNHNSIENSYTDNYTNYADVRKCDDEIPKMLKITPPMAIRSRLKKI